MCQFSSVFMFVTFQSLLLLYGPALLSLSLSLVVLFLTYACFISYLYRIYEC